jgi:hypothetical protein
VFFFVGAPYMRQACIRARTHRQTHAGGCRHCFVYCRTSWPHTRRQALATHWPWNPRQPLAQAQGYGASGPGPPPPAKTFERFVTCPLQEVKDAFYMSTNSIQQRRLRGSLRGRCKRCQDKTKIKSRTRIINPNSSTEEGS